MKTGRDGSVTNRALPWLCATALLVVLAACGGGGDAVAPAPEPVSATVGRAGGGLEAASAQGGTLSLVLPVDAVAQDTVLTIAGLAADEGVIDRFSVQPGGLLLLTKGTLRYTGAQTLPDRTVLRWRVGQRRVALPTTRQGNTLTAATGYLGYGPSVAAGLGASNQRRTVLSVGGARPLSDGAPEEAEIEVATLDCDAEQARLPFLIASAASVGDEAQAVALFDELQAVVQTCQALQTAELVQRACDAYQSAELLARTTAADSYENLKSLAVRLMVSQAEVQLMGGACDAMPVDQVLELKFAQFSSFLLAEYAKPSFANVEYERARLELRDLYEYLAACEHMGAAAACQGMRNTLFPTLFDRLREGAYRTCRVQDDAVPLALMFAENLVFSRQDRPLRDPASRVGPYLDLGSFTYADLEADIAHCRSAATVTTFSDAQGVPVQQSSTDLAGGADPGAPPAPLAVSVPRDGSITFGGDVRALTCPDGSIGIDRVVARVGGVEVDSRVINGRRFMLDTQPFDFVVPTTMTRALLDPLRDSGFTIDVFREGDACQGGFSRSFKLYSVVVSLPEIGLSVTPQASTVMPGGTVQFSARVSGVPSTDVQWSASAGFISSTGLFTAPITSGPVTVQAAIVANPSIAAVATVTVGALPLNWGGTITFTHNESLDGSTREGVAPMGDITQVSRSVVESYRRTTTITLPVEFALRATDGTPAVVTVGAPSGSTSVVSSMETWFVFFHTNLPGCIISRHGGSDTRQSVDSGFSGSGMVIDIRVTSDGQYSVDAVGTIVGMGQSTKREFRFTSYSPQDCGLVVGDFDQTIVAEAGGGLTDELPLQRGAITNGQIKGSASQTEGDRTVTMTWEFLPR